MPKQSKKQTGMGADAFFQSPPASEAASPPHQQPVPDSEIDDKPERRSFNLKPSTLRLLDEIQIKTIRDGDKWTLSAIVEQGIALVAEEMGVKEHVSA